MTLDPQTYHLGIEGLPEWRHFNEKKPHTRELHLKLPGLRPTAASTLILHQQDVKEGWEVRIQPSPSGQALHHRAGPGHNPGDPSGLDGYQPE